MAKEYPTAQDVQTPVNAEQLTQLAGQAKHVLFPGLKLPEVQFQSVVH